MRRRPRRAPREAGDGTETIRKNGPSASRDEAGRSFDQEDRRPAGCRGEDPDPPVGPPPRQGQGASQAAAPVLGLGLEAIQGMTNAMNAIANQVIRSSGRSGRNAGWLYFDGTFRDSKGSSNPSR